MSISDILDRLQELENSHQNKELHSFFSGEWDSNQTTFEELSNNLRVGVKAHDSKTGGAMLRLVRMVIDENPDILGYAREDSGENLSPDSLIATLAEHEDTYLTEFEPHDPLTVRLSSSEDLTIIVRKPEEVDWWDLPRLRKELL